MAENSSIEWTDHTFNPWIGCTKVSPGCANCYAARQDGFRKWTPEGWGKGKPRRRTSAFAWGTVRRWNRKFEFCHPTPPAEPLRRPRVFCASLADWLDDEVPLDWLWDLIGLIKETPNLDWLLLTKRPENFHRRFREVCNRGSDLHDDFIDEWLFGRPPANVWIGTTVENQDMANERIPELLKIPARVRFLSCEPLLGRVDLCTVFDIWWNQTEGMWYRGDSPSTCVDQHGHINVEITRRQNRSGIHWVIAGGESGPGARPMHPDWVRSLREQCFNAGVPFFFKQWGEFVPISPVYGREDFDEIGDLDRQVVIEINGKMPMGMGDKVHWQPRPELSPWIMERVGKKAAGRLLDGREWNEFPTP